MRALEKINDEKNRKLQTKFDSLSRNLELRFRQTLSLVFLTDKENNLNLLILTTT